MTMTAPTATRRVATYERVSSEDQRERETIRTQTDALERRLARESDIEVVAKYWDDGVSGTIALADRLGGRQLLDDAAAGRFDELWIVTTDRLGRDAPDVLLSRRRLRWLGIRLMTLEGEVNPLVGDIMSVIDDNARVTFLANSARGMDRAAREGRYTGGIVPYGYRVAGTKQTARLEPDRALVRGDLAAADVIHNIYQWIALEGRSCRSVATELNALAITTHYVRDGRGVRGRATQGRWRAGRVRNMLVNPVYKGVLQYGRRIDQRSARSERRGHEIIEAQVEPLVSAELWHAAQEALARNRTIPKNTSRVYLLGGVIACGTCGLAYTASQGRPGQWWYRCGGRHAERGEFEGRCPSSMVAGRKLEPAVWTDIERFLRDPGDVLADLAAEANHEGEAAVAEAESITLARAIEALDEQRSRAIDLAVGGVMTKAELQTKLAGIAGQRSELERRLTALQPAADLPPSPTEVDLLGEVRRRIDAGLTDAERHLSLIHI